MFVDATTPNTAPSVHNAIRQAARVTGASFQYLLAAAKVESNLDPSASARTSSAGGLFQFIDQTWLGTLKQSGGALGYGRYAAAIERTDSGRYVVSDPSLRREIMALRKDPTANAVMAGAFTKANADYLSEKLGRAPTDGELYMAHFLGPRGAANLINLAAATPNALAKDAFPRAAASNKSIFYGEGGRPRSFAEVTRSLSGRYDVARAATSAAPVASATPSRATQAYAAASPAAAANMTAALAAANAGTEMTFNNPYRPHRAAASAVSIQTPVQRAARAVMPATAESQQAAAPGQTIAQAQTVASMRQTDADGEPLGLFQDMKPNVRALFTGRG